ncbi:MAG: alanine--tRNA ligase-related protein [Patescibacteria group bacterium]|nr:alanine--tRNA ligase-related protein [Patescibacteria group bacterium]
MITSEEVRKLFINFFEKRGHKNIPSSSLIPSDDLSVLLIPAGMQPLKKYFTGEKNALNDFGTQRLISIQKCFRTTDIDEIGDERHLTFFEMLGNFSFSPVGSDDPSDYSNSGYFKKSAIYWAYEFLIQELGLKIDYVSIFKGENNIPLDEEAKKIWLSLGLSEDQIKLFGREDNFWGPTGDEGPCGPTTEIYVDNIEIWNLVFNEYYQEKNGVLRKLNLRGVDTGMGLERLMKVIQKTETIFETDLFEPLRITLLNLKSDINQRDLRIILDHLRSSVFLISDGVLPSNLERGYILRRILRRLMLKLVKYNLLDYLDQLVLAVKNKFNSIYENLNNYDKIINVIKGEFVSFEKTLRRGLNKFDRIVVYRNREEMIEKLFIMFSSYGLPLDISAEILKERGVFLDNKDLELFQILFKKHQEVSRPTNE